MSDERFGASAAVARVLERSKRPPLQKRPGTISLNAGDPDFETPQHVRDALTDAVNGGHTHYVDGTGDPELRAAIAADLTRRSGVEWDPAQVLITHGGTGGLAAVFLGAIDAGERVVLPEPTYSLYADLCAWVGADVVQVPLAADFHLDLDAIRLAAPGAKLLVLCSPGNPTGVVYRRDELEAVAEIAREHDLLVLSDEAYDHIVYDGVDFVSALEVAGLRDRLVYCQTFSKVLSMTGWRIGYLAGPAATIAAAGRVVRTLIGPLNAAVQRAALVAFTTPTEWPERMRQEYQYRRDLVLESLDGLPGVTLRAPEGAFYAFVKVPAGRTSKDVVEAARGKGVIIRSGAEFGPSGEGYVRLAFSSSRDDLEASLPRLREVFLGAD
ncbi:MAG: pyridoxal phosphate-dependent aminotransferase [Candidatus Dormiibacterota bacterium]